MKRLVAAALAAALMLTPVSSQAFFLGDDFDFDDIIDYKLELLGCFGVMFTPDHCATKPVIPSTVQGGPKSIVEQQPAAPIVVDCYAYLLRGLPIGARVHVATLPCPI